ncbi:MAG: Integrase catalytic region [Berkelbacteria bacterium GW2011_GWA2_35_9]|uniref:Integrase catalytic region n=1 Tax=Berkelbacteria bacterium GW2011_GWA2_35_9 TaxID=1618333 RepID=A0A0G0D631_9BACT|nr:MAG: Integrase catalytic region [Berkelbacteria bacterium GW2011_GWA2_35_9]
MQTIYLSPANITQPLFRYPLFKRKPIELLDKTVRWRKQADLVKLSFSARLRLEWMIFYETVGNHNAYTTAQHFSITPKTFYKWHKRFDNGKVRLLEEQSRRPDKTRQWEVTLVEESRIKQLRIDKIHYGKKKLKKLYFNTYNEVISTWKIERVIRKHNLYPNPIKQAKYRRKLKNQINKKRIQNLDMHNQLFFLLHIDTIVIYWGSIKRYILTACDHTGKLGYARMYKNKSSRSAQDFLYRLHYLIDTPLAHIQTDNGSEFSSEFEDAITQLNATHWFSRNHTPQDNAIIERFNQTLQDEWLNDSNFTSDIRKFNQALTVWLEEYNFIRPHQTLDYLTPIEYYLNTLQLNNNLLPMWSAANSRI